MSSIVKLLRKIGGAKASPATGSAGELAIWKAGAKTTDATSLYAHDGTQWVEVLDTRGKVVAPHLVTSAATAPASPRAGDFWLNTTTNLLSIWDGASWLSTDTHQAATSVIAPVNPTTGSMWLDPGKKDLMVWDGSQWANVAFKNVTNTFTKPQIIDVTDASAALHIKQLGAGAALFIEDEANPDATPFVVSANGDVGIGTPAPKVALNIERPMPSVYLKSTVGNGSATFSGITGQDAAGTTQWFVGKEAAGNNVVALSNNLAGGTLVLNQAGAGDIHLDTNGATRVAVNKDGNVGVGGAASVGGTRLNVVSDNGFPAYFQSTTNVSEIGFSTSVGQAYIGARDDNLTFKLGGAERAFMNKNGALTFGQTSVLTPHLNTNPGVSITDLTMGFEIRASAPSGNVGVFQRSGSDGNVFLFFKNTAMVGSIGVNGTSTGFNTTSDYRLKENVTPINGAAARVMALKPSRFNFKQEPGKIIDGFIAHEVQAVVPEAVTGAKDAMREEDTFDAAGNKNGTKMVPDYQGIDQGKLVPLLTAALQEALKRIEALEAKP